MLRGSCLCGDVRYEIEGAIDYASHCHCSQCRKGHGAAFATYGVVPAAKFRYGKGSESVASFNATPAATRTFCRRCGSNLEWRGASRPDLVGFALGTLDDDPHLKPRWHIYVGSRAPWFEITDDLRQFTADVVRDSE